MYIIQILSYKEATRNMSVATLTPNHQEDCLPKNAT